MTTAVHFQHLYSLCWNVNAVRYHNRDDYEQCSYFIEYKGDRVIRSRSLGIAGSCVAFFLFLFEILRGLNGDREDCTLACSHL